MAKLTKYENTLKQEGITKAQQESLLQARVLVMGAGGLGSGVIMNLAAMGVGHIKIVDDGIVTETDFNRQLIHKEKNIGRARVISAKDWIQEFNSDIKVDLEKIRLNDLNYFGIIQGFNIIVDCFDSYESKYLLNEIALRHNLTLVHGATKGYCGQVTTIVPTKTGCLSCVIPKPKNFNNEKFANISPVVNVVASFQAQEVMKIITQAGEPLLNKLLVYDGLNTRFKIINYTKNMACETCSSGMF